MAAKENFTAMLALSLLLQMLMAGAQASEIKKESIFDAQAAVRAARGGAAERFEAKALEEKAAVQTLTLAPTLKEPAVQTLTPIPSLKEAASVQTLTLTLPMKEAASVQTLTLPLKEAAGVQTLTLAIPLVHRDAVAGGTNASYEQRIQQMLKRDAARVAAIYSRFSNLTFSAASSERPSTAAVESPVESGKGQGSGEYFTLIGVGTPARQQLLVLDTGSDITWLQCQPCEDCYSQTDPIFNPAFSSSFNNIPCDSNLCRQLDQSGCSRAGDCQYQVSYGDGSYTVGSFDTETVMIGKTRVSNVALGCGHDNEGLFVGAAGLLGLGGGAFSLPSQLSHTSGNVFSYCLVYRDSGAASTLQFGREAVSREAVFVPLLRNSRMPTFYYVSLAGIFVGGKLLNIPESVFRIDAAGNGGVILDSGTPVTRLQHSAYVAVRDAFVAGAGNLQSSDGFALFDTCFQMPNRVSVSVPTIAFQFSNGVSLPLPAKNYLVGVSSRKICLAFAPVASGMSIIGSIQQQGIRVSFDPVDARVGFAVNQC